MDDRLTATFFNAMRSTRPTYAIDVLDTTVLRQGHVWKERIYPLFVWCHLSIGSVHGIWFLKKNARQKFCGGLRCNILPQLCEICRQWSNTAAKICFLGYNCITTTSSLAPAVPPSVLEQNTKRHRWGKCRLTENMTKELLGNVPKYVSWRRPSSGDRGGSQPHYATHQVSAVRAVVQPRLDVSQRCRTWPELGILPKDTHKFTVSP